MTLSIQSRFQIMRIPPVFLKDGGCSGLMLLSKYYRALGIKQVAGQFSFSQDDFQFF
jgi:hypothetical protein